MPIHNSPELLNEDPPIIRAINDIFVEAYQRQMDGEQPIHELMGLAGKTEAIALNPKTYPPQGDNARYIIIGGSLDFNGFSFQAGEDKFIVKYVAFKVALPPGNSRSIADIFLEEVILKTVYSIGEDGRVTNGSLWLEPTEIEELTSSLSDCELAPEVPEWAREAT